MMFPLDFGELSILFAVITIILLVTSELLSPYYCRIKVLFNRKKLARAAIVFSALFLLTVSMRILEILFTAF